ncbi:hypothetical protein KCU92_g263, partial [Aureobasidium melanogenum]
MVRLTSRHIKVFEDNLFTTAVLTAALCALRACLVWDGGLVNVGARQNNNVLSSWNIFKQIHEQKGRFLCALLQDVLQEWRKCRLGTVLLEIPFSIGILTTGVRQSHRPSPRTLNLISKGLTHKCGYAHSICVHTPQRLGRIDNSSGGEAYVSWG